MIEKINLNYYEVKKQTVAKKCITSKAVKENISILLFILEMGRYYEYNCIFAYT